MHQVVLRAFRLFREDIIERPKSAAIEFKEQRPGKRRQSFPKEVDGQDIIITDAALAPA